MSWETRDSEQLRPCGENKTIIRFSNFQPTKNSNLFNLYSSQVEKLLPDLLQINGRHLRLFAVNKKM